MMMFVQLLVLTCACALGATDEVPSYGDIFDSITQAHITLSDTILSMDGNVPLLNDFRRHYAEIIHVLHDEAQHLNTNRLGPDYYRDYQPNINVSAPFAIANPQSVVDETNKVIKDIINRIDKVLLLVKASAQNGNKDSDKAIDDEMKKNVENYGKSIKIFLATGLLATQLNNYDTEDFAAIASNLDAHNFVINGAQKLHKIVMAQKNLYQLLYPPSD